MELGYFRHRDLSDIFTYDIARQSVVDKMVREISLEVREKSGKSQGILFSHFCGNPDMYNVNLISFKHIYMTIVYEWQRYSSKRDILSSFGFVHSDVFDLDLGHSLISIQMHRPRQDAQKSSVAS